MVIKSLVNESLVIKLFSKKCLSNWVPECISQWSMVSKSIVSYCFQLLSIVFNCLPLLALMTYTYKLSWRLLVVGYQLSVISCRLSVCWSCGLLSEASVYTGKLGRINQLCYMIANLIDHRLCKVQWHWNLIYFRCRKFGPRVSFCNVVVIDD